MILTCPNCGTQYAVKDGAIPPQGRQVRCASCKHSWHQDPEPSTETADEMLAPEPSDEAPPLDQPHEDESVAEASLIEPRSGPEAEERAFEQAIVEEEQAPPEQTTTVSPEPETFSPAQASADWAEPPQAEAADDEFSPFPPPDEMEPRRRGMAAPLLLVLVIVAVTAAAFWFLAPPEWKARLGVGGAGESPLALITTHMDRQRLESGNELLTVTGRVINPTGQDQPVPALHAQLRNRTGKIVYSWTIAPPAQSLGPGASASFNSAEVNVPAGGDELTITLGNPRA